MRNLATFRRKNALSDIGRVTSHATDIVFRGDFAHVHSLRPRRVNCAGLGALSRKIAPHLDEIVRNHAQPHPSSHAVQTGIQATT